MDYKKQIIELIQAIDGEKERRFLLQILTMVKTHIKRSGH